jgi:hypothetical protein
MEYIALSRPRAASDGSPMTFCQSGKICDVFIKDLIAFSHPAVCGVE